MKWGRKKSAASSSTTAAAIITRVLPVSWISKFKQKGGNFETSSQKEKQRGKVDFPTPKSLVPPGWREGRFYSMDEDDAYWRLSFTGGRRSTGGLMNPLWYDSDDEFQVPVLSFKSFGLRELDVSRSEENRNFDEMVLDIKKMKEKIHKEGISIGNDGFRGRKVNGGNDQKLRKQERRDLREKEEELERGANEEEKTWLKSAEKDVFEIEQKKMVQTKEKFSRKQHDISLPNLDLTSIEEDCAFYRLDAEGKNATYERLPITQWQNLEDKKIKEMKIKTESQRKSANVNRESHSRKTKHNNRAKAYSPRTECKIRALEDMKKSRMKLKKKVPEEQLMEYRTMFDSFAVVKSSFNPERDFTDSMVEMILEKEIKRPEELEELLACYLTLNCDEYHDLIIKVFRQVWFELNGGLHLS